MGSHAAIRREAEALYQFLVYDQAISARSQGFRKEWTFRDFLRDGTRSPNPEARNQGRPFTYPGEGGMRTLLPGCWLRGSGWGAYFPVSL